MIDCREAVRRMWAYLDHELGRQPLSEFEAHLEACQRCCGELEFSRHVRAMAAKGDRAGQIPEALRSRIEILLAEADQPTEGPA
jgi:mycothiol system anti-sigma-R factor